MLGSVREVDFISSLVFKKQKRRLIVKKAIKTSLLVYAGFMLAVILLGISPIARGVGKVTSQNGDVNGDGIMDVSDPIFLLKYIFMGGQAPVACAIENGLTVEQIEILSHLKMVELDDGLGKKAKTLQVWGVNLQIVNGEGSTMTKNGVGNLIVGYQEFRLKDNDRSGSHNIIGGMGQNYLSYGGFVVGENNSVEGEFASVAGGGYNKASGKITFIGGGGGWEPSYGNEACAHYSAILGGKTNRVGERSDPFVGIESTICGGQFNVASGDIAFIGGGGGWTPEMGNMAFGHYTAILGGQKNIAGDRNLQDHALGHDATVSGGWGNFATGLCSSVLGGYNNSTGGFASSISGGASNSAVGDQASVSGGTFNNAIGNYSSVSGGSNNQTSGSNSSISGGQFNIASGEYSHVCGGGGDTFDGGNEAFGRFCSILGGVGNLAGDTNRADHLIGVYSTISGGYANKANGYVSTVSGGVYNIASNGLYPTVSGGEHNQALGDYSTVSGGSSNIALHKDSTVSGGCNNVTSSIPIDNCQHKY
jgi:hypothetical protein